MNYSNTVNYKETENKKIAYLINSVVRVMKLLFMILSFSITTSKVTSEQYLRVNGIYFNNHHDNDIIKMLMAIMRSSSFNHTINHQHHVQLLNNLTIIMTKKIGSKFINIAKLCCLIRVFYYVLI